MILSFLPLIGPPIRVSQKLSLQSQENLSRIQDHMTSFATPKRFESMNVRSSVKVTKRSPSVRLQDVGQATGRPVHRLRDYRRSV